jgi:peptidoglycan hydrolase-like protein with peptidoglycan-binding domain
MDDAAINYDAEATIDDESCEYPPEEPVFMCEDSEATNFGMEEECQYEVDMGPTLNITYPNVEIYELYGEETLTADFMDDDETVDDIEWTVFTGSCESEGGEAVAGNTDGFEDGYNFEEGTIEMYLDTTLLENGDYCLQVDPIEQGEEEDLFALMDFTIYNPVYTISGVKYEDVDKDGAYNEEVDTETVANWEIIATEEESGEVITTTTDDEGYYELDLPAGAWTITEETRNGWEQVLAFGNSKYSRLSDESEFEEVQMDCTFYFGYEMKYRDGQTCNFLNVRVSSSNGGGGTRVRPTATPMPQVLGAATSTTGTTTMPTTLLCEGMYLTSYMRMGMENPVDQVLKLQVFLNAIGSSTTVPTTGIFDEATDAAVRAFQVKYLVNVLTPWNLTVGTGYVYKTTRATINNMVCPGSEVMPTI